MKAYLSVILAVFLMAGIVNAISCGDTITSSYTMTSDLTGCTAHGIIIGANNIVLDCQGHTLSGSNNGVGVFLTGISGSVIKNCIINNFVDGIALISSSNNNLLTNNTANSNTWGIYMATSSSNNTLTSNTANSNQQGGIFLSSSSNNTLTSNTANSNLYYGIYMASFSSNNILTNNTANNNSQYGIYLIIGSGGNLIYNNYFNNTINAYDTGTNLLNTTKTPGTNIIGGPSMGGNYWADPSGTGYSQTCTDTDSDGFCDAPYTVGLYSVDYLPLATYVNPPTPAPEFPIPLAAIAITAIMSVAGYLLTRKR